ncbi:hypothetical protein NUSPORA_02088 [Nucleospora cyclopteri]
MKDIYTDPNDITTKMTSIFEEDLKEQDKELDSNLTFRPEEGHIINAHKSNLQRNNKSNTVLNKYEPTSLETTILDSQSVDNGDLNYNNSYSYQKMIINDDQAYHQINGEMQMGSTLRPNHSKIAADNNYINNAPNHFNNPELIDLLSNKNDSPIDMEQMRILWKKEKNRIAAKKSREKKAFHIKELEKREKLLAQHTNLFMEAIFHYDQILHIFSQYAIGNTFNLPEILEKIKNKRGTFIRDVQNLINMKLMVNDEKINDILNILKNKKKEKE